jgi:hypothetical protein
MVRRQPGTRFDIVILWDVIEHLRDPWDDLRVIQQLLVPRGRLIVSTMNTRSLRARLEGAKWHNHSNPTHLFFFHRSSLRAIICHVGFDDVEEWVLPIRYPNHGVLRQSVHRFLTACSLNGEIVFAARKKGGAAVTSDDAAFVSGNCPS